MTMTVDHNRNKSLNCELSLKAVTSTRAHRAHSARAILFMCKYLCETRNKGIILDLQTEKSLEVYADADFAGNWNKSTAANDVSTAKSRTGYVITFAGCPILWASHIQTQIALSTTEAEYISLSESL